jgi:hypothetical protein
VRLPQAIFLSKPVPPRAIAHVDQWSGEYVMGSDAVRALRESSLTGYVLRPILHPRTRAARDGGMHLCTGALLPPALFGPSTYETFAGGPAQPSQPRRYGLLSYAPGALDAAPDFARTAEPWEDWDTPTWVVRRGVRQWFEGAGLRGWGLRPVLQEGTAPHREHEERWQGLLARLRAAGAEVAA